MRFAVAGTLVVAGLVLLFSCSEELRPPQMTSLFKHATMTLEACALGSLRVGPLTALEALLCDKDLSDRTMTILASLF